MYDSFGARSTFRVGGREYEIYRLDAMVRHGFDPRRLPYALRVLLENLLRNEDGAVVTADHVRALAGWDPHEVPTREISFMPARVLLQDFTGVPAVVDLAAMRDAMAALGGDPTRINPLQPVELVIDHSMQVDAFGSRDALRINADLEFARNRERYALLRWAQRAFRNFRVVPPDTGIVHQVNLEFLARVVFTTEELGGADSERPLQAYPDSVVGTDSHTPMVNGLGVLGWGVGGIEAEAAMLGQPISMLIPQVVGLRLEGALREGATATDLVLTVTELLRRRGVVGKFVEFYGPGLGSLPVADRATIANMSPEFGATCTMFPIDEETLRYLRFTGRSPERVELIEAYALAQGLYHLPDAPEPAYTETLALDLGAVEPSVAGPRRPQDRVPLSQAGRSFREALPSLLSRAPAPTRKEAATEAVGGHEVGVWGEGQGGLAREGCESAERDHCAEGLGHGAVVIAAITSCTNTSNPAVMLAAGLLARKAVERGLTVRPWVKTSLSPGSQVVTRYYEAAGLTPYLEQLGFHTVGYGCATCIGNSGPLPPPVSEAVERDGLAVCAVLSGNRNFEGRIHSEVRANYLMSPPLVVAYAIAGRIDVDLATEPLGSGADGRPVFLRDIWPSQREVREVMDAALRSEMFRETYADVFRGDERWRRLAVAEGDLVAWDPESTYVRDPPYFAEMSRVPPEEVEDVHGARALLVLGDSVTTDHISPAGTIKRDSPAGRYLLERGVEPAEFNSYGSRRGNHEVMVRGTFANVRIRNQLAPGTEGGVTTYLPTGEVMSVYDAAMRYAADRTPLVVLAGKEYGTGSSRDWAAKGPRLLGVRAVIAESFERIHRSNLVGMGVLPLEFVGGESVASLGLTGHESFDVAGLAEAFVRGFAAGRTVRVRATRPDGTAVDFEALVRIDTPQEALYFQHGGILPFVLRQLLGGRARVEVTSCAVATASQTPPGDSGSDGVVEEGSVESFPASDSPAY